MSGDDGESVLEGPCEERLSGWHQGRTTSATIDNVSVGPSQYDCVFKR